MGVPPQVRDSKCTTQTRVAWTILMLAGWAVLYGVTFSPNVWVHWLGGIPPLPSPDMRALVFTMATARTISQVCWGLTLCPYKIPLGFSFAIAVLNTVIDSVATIAALRTRTHFEPWYDWTVLAVFCLGLALERGSEVQRVQFKQRAENRGKPHITGLHSIVVHPNYLGYVLHRSAFLALSGVWQLQGIALVLLLNLAYGDVMAQKTRNVAKYGDEFKLYWDTTPKLVPGVF